MFGRPAVSCAGTYTVIFSFFLPWIGNEYGIIIRFI